MKTLSSRMCHTKLNELILALLSVFLCIIEVGVIYQIKILKSNQVKYNAKAKIILADANLKFLEVSQVIAQDYNYYDKYRTNYSKSKHSEYFKTYFSNQLTDAVIRSTKKPFDEAYYKGMYSDAYHAQDAARKWFHIGEQSRQSSNMLELILLVAFVCSALTAWVASKFYDKKELRSFKSIQFPQF